jgi:hypothetical protein
VQRPSFPSEDDADPPAALSALAEARTSYDAGDFRETATRIDRAAAAVRSAGFVLRARALAHAAEEMRLSPVVAPPKPPRPSGGKPPPRPVVKPPQPNPAPARLAPPPSAGKPAMRRTMSGTIEVEPDWIEGAIVTDSGREPMGPAPSGGESVDVWVGPSGEIAPAVRGQPVPPGYAEARLVALSPNARLSERLRRR